ncbi:MAG: glycosyltransferase family 2 protein [Alphaproteobacteria bacterium]
MKIAVLIPCYDEATTIATVVREFRAALPGADVYVYDNNSRDDTVARAAAAGAVVRRETLQGKGNVVRRMFADVEADVYVMIDGDATYDAASAPILIDRLVSESLDMVVGVRLTDFDSAAFRPGHHLGNMLFTAFFSRLFGNRFTDLLSGYRVFSRRFVRSFPALSTGFEIEAELAVHALSLKMPVSEVPTPYGQRPEGSVSKLSTWRDGLRILLVILSLFREERPLLFFSLIAAVLAAVSVALGTPVILHWLETGLVPKLPTALLAASVMILAFLGLVSGVVLDNVTRGRREMKRLHYLSHRGPGEWASGEKADDAAALLRRAEPQSVA